MFDSLVRMKEYTLRTSVPIVFLKVAFGRDHSSLKIPCNIFYLKRDFHFPILHGVNTEITSLVDSIKIHMSLASNGPKPNAKAKHVMMPA
jgi:hypothetical protein